MAEIMTQSVLAFINLFSSVVSVWKGSLIHFHQPEKAEMTGSVCGTCHLNGMKNPSDCLRDQFFNSMVKRMAWLSAFNHSLRLKPALIVVISHPLLTITAADLEQNPSPPCGFHPCSCSSDSKKRNTDPSYLIKAKKENTERKFFLHPII